METFVVLLRGINVGGHGKLPMADLRALLGGLGLADVKTYIQSGNVVLRSGSAEPDDLAERIAAAVEAERGFRPEVLAIPLPEFRAAADGSPFPDADPKRLHLLFLREPATSPDLAGMDAVKTPTEEYVLAGKVLYLHTPDGFGRSRLASKVERLLGVPATARNARTVRKLLDLAEPPPG